MFIPEIIVIVGVFLWAVYALWREWYQWNGGVCRKTGDPWVKFGTDSLGVSGYTNTEGNHIWVCLWDRIQDKHKK